MKKYFCITLVFLFSLVIKYEVQSQEIESKYAYAEKIYIHLSSTIFTNDKTVWFNSVVTDLAYIPTKLSGVSHMELIDFDKRIIDKKKLKLENGIADGYFQLTEDMPSRRYLMLGNIECNRNIGYS